MSSQHIKTIFFGGSFDPPHVAHMQMLDQAAAAISADKFVIVPAVKAASVTGKKGPSAGFEDRISMLGHALEEHIFQNITDRSSITISDIEKLLPVPNYSATTVEKYKNLKPNEKIYFLMGQDQLANFHAWNEPQKLLSLANIIAVKRKGSSQSLIEDAEEMLSLLDEETEKKESTGYISFKTRFNTSIFLVDNDISEAQSTVIREKSHKFEQNWLHQKVSSFIEKHNLY